MIIDPSFITKGRGWQKVEVVGVGCVGGWWGEGANRRGEECAEFHDQNLNRII